MPAQQDGFNEVFLGQHCWYAIRIGGGMLPKSKYVAAYQSNPVSAITYYAKVSRIEPYGDEGKYKLIFAEPAKALPQPWSETCWPDSHLCVRQRQRLFTVLTFFRPS